MIQKGFDVRPFIVVAGMLTQPIGAAAPRMGDGTNGSSGVMDGLGETLLLSKEEAARGE